ncbi:integral membrane sensor signal transduction histidine kinase [Paenibacillus amylolyticus]|uniref:histidine kinase n=2 Tax=Paenibacillus amylolyticus TaxID=1451 RepID=A0A100VSK0_PAEAM|nr:integral membrane sensor signal transduction histidine kinase [Paenibacillus amylolyticus]
MLSYTMKMVIFPLGCLLVILSSYVLRLTPHPAFMLLAGTLFVASIYGERRYPVLRKFHWIFLGLFHYFSQLNWCNMLYYMLIISVIQDKQRVAQTLPISLLLMLQYTVIRLSYVPVDTYALLVSLFDLLTSVVIIFLYHTMINSEAEKRRLREKNRFLTLHDPLTGLLNYEGYMEVLHKTVEERRSFLLVLLNVNNFSGFKKDSEDPWCSVITGTGEMITNQFTDAYGISRYAGDRFAVVLPEIQDVEERMASLLSVQLQGLQVSYSISLYPEMSDTLQHFMTVAEDRLLQQQRSKWLKNEEEVFRSERLRAVGELAAGMAHEIRNPLTAIRGFLQLSRGQAYNIAPWYEVIMGEVTRVTDLTAEFLQFSKPHANHMKPEQLGHCLERVMSLTESDAASRGHRITLEMTSEPIVVNMDRDKIVQVLINLIRNAFEAMEDPGEVHMDLLQDGEAVLVSITDTGSGIPENSLSTIFNPFYTTKEEGTGLGLALCQKIVQDHNGKITVHSEMGVGSTFTLHLPMEA